MKPALRWKETRRKTRMSDTNNPPMDNTNPPVEGNVPVPPAPAHLPENNGTSDRMEERLERLGGEPAPAITPEEFARLQKAGQVHIDARGRVKTARRTDA